MRRRDIACVPRKAGSLGPAGLAKVVSELAACGLDLHELSLQRLRLRNRDGSERKGEMRCAHQDI